MKGFTLIELIIYIAIVAMVLVIASGFAWNIIEGKVKSTAYQEVQQNARFAMEKVSRELRAGTDPVSININDYLSNQVEATSFSITNNQILLTISHKNYDASISLQTTAMSRQ